MLGCYYWLLSLEGTKGTSINSNNNKNSRRRKQQQCCLFFPSPPAVVPTSLHTILESFESFLKNHFTILINSTYWNETRSAPASLTPTSFEEEKISIVRELSTRFSQFRDWLNRIKSECNNSFVSKIKLNSFVSRKKTYLWTLWWSAHYKKSGIHTKKPCFSQFCIRVQGYSRMSNFKIKSTVQLKCLFSIKLFSHNISKCLIMS